MIKPLPPDSENKEPWWSDEAPQDAPLPEGFPERPDSKKVDALRKQLKAERSSRNNPQNDPALAKYATKAGKRAKDIGTYTLIPMMMLAGPIVGYGLGWVLEKQWGGAPWTGVIGLLLGVAASFRQVYLILAKKAEADKRARKD
jgi:F0F1-type ATP synthase assembly protein I